MKLSLRAGVALVERHQGATGTAAGADLVDAARALPDVLRRYYTAARL